MKKLKIISIVAGMLILLLVGLGIVFSTLYEDKVKGYIIQQINDNVATQIDIEAVEFSVFKKFPYASLEFKKVTATEVTKRERKGTLFSAASIYLQFNVFDILNDNYVIKKVSVEEGLVNINIDKYGNDNYHFWKTQKDKQPSSLSLELDDLTFKEMTFYVLNEYKNLDMAIEAVHVSLAGNFSDDEFTLTTKAKLLVQQINDEESSLMRNKIINLNTSLHVNQKTQLYHIKKGEIRIQDLQFNLSGNIKNQTEGIQLDILSKGDGLEIEALFSLFPEKQREVLSAYRTIGNITYASSIKGELSSKKSPAFNAEFTIKNGAIIEKKSTQSLTNLNIIGHFSNGKNNNSHTSILTLDQLEADFGAGHISGKYVLSNFVNPYIKCNAKATIDINTAKYFFKLDTLEIANGSLLLNLNYEGYIKELNNIQAKDLQKLTATGTAQLIDGEIKLINGTHTLKNMNGSFQFNNNNIRVDSLSAQTQQSNFKLKGNCNNLLSYLFIDNQTLTIHTKLYATKLVLDELLINDEKSIKDSNYTLALPNNIRFNFSATIDTFQFRKFHATHLTGNIELDDKVLTATQLSFNSMEGKVTGNFALDDSHNNELLMTSKVHLENINIRELFIQFENFGQKHILSENLKGKATTDIEFASVWDNKLNADKDKIYVLADLNIENGALIHYQPIYAMSKFIDLEELEDIQFKTLRTQIEIKNQTVFIPKTSINSSAIDVTISGKHSFDNRIDYRFKLLMNDILWRKAKNNKKENSEFGYVEDDGLGKTTLFLRMVGTIDDYKLSYDTKGLKESFKENIQQEKQTLKTILNKEFGWFKKDSTLKKEEKPKEDGFQIEWEEEETKDGKNQDVKKKKTIEQPKKKKGLGKFIDDITKPAEEEYEKNDKF
ncbi:MAG: hypothetical protein J5I47_01330 [Vicingus serpentipes]|nr:hypothetical protein [Vicingus serpentipes]